MEFPNLSKKIHHGIRVSTFRKANLEISHITSDDAPYEADHSLFALRCLRKANNQTNNSFTESHQQTQKRILQYSQKEILEKLMAIQNVRLTRKIEKREGEGSGLKKSIRFFLEDADENLDFCVSGDEESFRLDSLGFNVATEEGALNILCGCNQTSENNSILSTEPKEKGFELSNMRLLRNKEFNVQMKNENGVIQILGKVDYSMRKYRIYDRRNRFLYKIHRTSSNDPKSQALSIKDLHELEVGRIVVTHTSLNTAKCEAALPEKCESSKKLLIIGALLTIMEKLESYKGHLDDEVSPQKSIFSTIFSFLSCQNS